MSAEWFVLSVAACLALASCKGGPSTPFDGTCTVSQEKVVPGQSVTLIVEPSTRAGVPTSPTGTLQLEFVERGAPAKVKCTLRGTVTTASYRQTGESAVKFPLSGDCADPDALEPRASFTPEGATAPIGCTLDTPASVRR